MALLGFEPEITGLVETLEFKSSLSTAKLGNEQRGRARTAPRSLVEMTIASTDPERNVLNGFLFASQGIGLQAGSWWEARRLSQNLSAGTRNIALETANYGDFVVGGYAMLYSRLTGATELFQIGALSATSIQIPSINPGLQSAWLQAGTVVMPVRTVLLNSEQSQSPKLNGLTETKLRYTAIDNTDLRGTNPIVFPTYLGKYVMTKINSVKDSLTVGFDSGAQVFDPGNLLIQVTTWPRPKITQSFRFMCRSQQEIWELRMFFHAIGGRQKSFWMGTGKNDLPPNTGTGAGQTYIQIDKQGFVANYGAVPVAPRGHLQVVRKDRTTSRHQITAAIVSGNNEQLGISPAMSPLLDLSQVGRVEFLTLCRLQEDTVKITHTGLGRAVFEGTVIGVAA